MANADKVTECTKELLDEIQESSGATVSQIINSLAAQVISKANQMVGAGYDEIRTFYTQQVPRSTMYHTAGGYVLCYVAPTPEHAGAALLFGGLRAPYHRLDETAFYLVSLDQGGGNSYIRAKQITRLNLAKPADLQLIWDVIGTA